MAGTSSYGISAIQPYQRPQVGSKSPFNAINPADQLHYRSDLGETLNDAAYQGRIAANQQQERSNEQNRQRADQMWQDQYQAGNRATEDIRQMGMAQQGFGTTGAGRTAARGGGTLSVPSLPLPKPPGMSQQEALAGLKSLGSPVSAAEQPEASGAQDLAYSRARDRIGSQRAAAVKSFQGMMDARGLTGSTGPGFEGGGVANIIAGGASDLADFTAGQANEQVQRAQEVSDRAFAANDARKRIALSALADFYTRAGFAGGY